MMRAVLVTKIVASCALVAWVPAVFADWELKTRENGISTYTKEINGSDYMAVRVEGETDKSVAELVQINTEAPRLVEWMETFESVETSEKRSWFDYDLLVTYDFPFPFSDRVSKTRTRLFRSGEVVYLTFRSLPLETDYEEVAMQEVRGFWAFRPTSSGTTKIVYQTHVEPGGNLGPTIANAFALDVPVSTFGNLLAMPVNGSDPSIDVRSLPVGTGIGDINW